MEGKSLVASSSQKMNQLLHSKYLIEVSVLRSESEEIGYKLVKSASFQVLKLILRRESTGKY